MKIIWEVNNRAYNQEKILKISVYAVCEDNIEDSFQGSILCECTGNTWIHRKCAGLTKTCLSKVTENSMPFFCFQCQLLTHEKLIFSLEASINQLVDQVTALSPKVPITGNSQIQLKSISSPTHVTSPSACPFSSSIPIMNPESYSESISACHLRSEKNVENRPLKHSPEQKFNILNRSLISFYMDWMSYQMVIPDCTDNKVALTALHLFSLVLFLPCPMQSETTTVLVQDSSW